jgi:sterol desaturase/sphingolipid hydroxylase (fatty acid hydroxylase superfamily)
MEPQTLRLAVFAVILTACVSAETLSPARRPGHDRLQRFARHGGLMVASSLLARLIVPTGLIGVALWAEARDAGLFNVVSVPAWLAFAITLVVMDFAVWAQHVAMHQVPWLWRLHRVHHSDTQMDVTTAARFHPMEIVVSLGWKGVVILGLGAPPEAALAYEILLSAMALLTHANIAIPGKVDAALRLVIVTPAFHLVHHSANRAETNSNYGNFLSVWDRMFSLYKPEKQLQTTPIGLESFRQQSDQTFWAMVRNPLEAAAGHTDKP